MMLPSVKLSQRRSRQLTDSVHDGHGMGERPSFK
jgi:hypothetical protein